MLRLVVPFILLLLSLFGGAVWLLEGNLNPQAPDEQARAEKPGDASSAKEMAAQRATDHIADLHDALAPATPRSEGDAPAFDIARIDPEGTSVFAGRAEPNTRITVTADGQEVGTADVDENGEWTLTTEARITNPDAKLALFKAAHDGASATAERSTAAGSDDAAKTSRSSVTANNADAATSSPNKVADADATAGSAPASGVDEPQPKSAGAVTANMLKNLEGMVADARSEAEQSGGAGAMASPTAAADTEPQASQQRPQQLANIPQTPQQFADTPPQHVAEVPGAGDGEGAAPLQHSAASPPAPVAPAQTPPPGTAQQLAAQTPTPSISVPVPVTFVYNEATLTSDGRRAAALLLEYLQIKRFPKITLTGHADERGTNELNMSLSRERLETVARFLREGGYAGQLELIPKGKTEPYLGVVRGDFSQEDLWQLDRRVELVVTR